MNLNYFPNLSWVSEDTPWIPLTEFPPRCGMALVSDSRLARRRARLNRPPWPGPSPSPMSRA
eukprot:scaffold214657_cov30-Tisochrysis_lutea.AAC.1